MMELNGNGEPTPAEAPRTLVARLLHREDPYEGVVDPDNALYRIYKEAREAAGPAPLWRRLRAWHRQTFAAILPPDGKVTPTLFDLWSCGVTGSDVLEALYLEQQESAPRSDALMIAAICLMASGIYAALRIAFDGHMVWHWRTVVIVLPLAFLAVATYKTAAEARARRLYKNQVAPLLMIYKVAPGIAEKAARNIGRAFAAMVRVYAYIVALCLISRAVHAIGGVIYDDSPTSMKRALDEAGAEMLSGTIILIIAGWLWFRFYGSIDITRMNLRESIEGIGRPLDRHIRRTVLKDEDG